MKTALASLIILLFTASFTRPADDMQAVEQAVEALRKALIDPDRATLDRLTATDLTYGHSGGNVENKAEFIEALVSGSSDFQTIELTNQTVRVVGKTAIVRHQLAGAIISKGVAGQVNLNVLLVWIKQGGDWKLLARQAIKR